MSAAKVSNTGLFRNRFVQVILLSALLLQIGIWVRNFAVLLYVMEMTGEDPFAVSMISVAEFAPIFLFSFIGGTFADRWRPKRTMIGCDLLSAVSVFAVLAALVLASWKAVFLAMLVSSILSQFSQPSGMKLFKMHVPAELIPLGMSIYQTMFAVFMILGPVMGTFVYQTYGIQIAIAIMGVAFLLSAGVLMFLPPDKAEEATKKPQALREDIVQGFRYVMGHKVFVTLGACFLIVGFAIGMIHPLGIFIVTERLGMDKEMLQWLIAANGMAMILGGGLTMVLSKKASPQFLLLVGCLLSAAGVLIVGLSTQLWLTLAGQFISGLAIPAIHIGINALILTHAATSFVGRVNGILNPLFIGAMVVTMSLAGLLKKVWSLVVVYELAAVLLIVGAVVILPLLRFPETRNEESKPAAL
ncbi:MAG: MFS transporter [Bacillus thermozeamaize]|uniref:MFS transporter n=1 Tax=Bacillus thermozeamaize TaxID=230954 RepID=A0A1Y3PM34_9BACI|nr:MAG: MFS transporter [Bacillus thermozeamaize]